MRGSFLPTRRRVFAAVAVSAAVVLADAGAALGAPPPGTVRTAERPSVGTAPSAPTDRAIARFAAEVVDRSGRPRFLPIPAATLREAQHRAEYLRGVRTVVRDAPASVAQASPDPYRPRQWGNGALAVDHLPAVDTSSQVVAVLDTGVLPTHEDFAPGQVLCDLGADLTGEGLSTDGCVDPHGHGTHVAGTVGAVKGNGRGVEGIAPGVRILPVRVLNSYGSGTAFGVAEGIVWAVDHGATVINMSLSGPFSQAYDDAVAYAVSRDVVVVAAAGNNRTSGNATTWPAASPGAVSVTATDTADNSTYFSNSNPTSDIAAPGLSVYSLGKTPTGYVYKSGTSMAAPHVAGVAALYRAARPAATEAAVQRAMYDTADDLEAPGKDNNTGHGLVDPLHLLTGRDHFPPPAPAQPQASVTPTSVTVTWPAVSGSRQRPVAGYRVYRDGQLLGTATGVRYDDRNVGDGARHAYTVTARGPGGESVPSVGVSADHLVPPATPSGVRASARNTTVKLSWAPVASTDGAPASGYRVYRGGRLLAATTDARYVDSGLVNGIDYTYAVTAYGTAGESAQSRLLTARPVTAPLAPSGLSATYGDRAVRLRWAAAPSTLEAPVSGHEVYRNGVRVATVGAGTTSYLDTGLANGVRYTYALRAIGRGGASAQTAAVSTRPVPRPTAGYSATTVAPGTNISITTARFRPGTTLRVTQTYAYYSGGVRKTATVRLASVTVASSGWNRVKVLPRQTARRGTLSVRGVDRNGTSVTIRTAIELRR